MFFRPFQPENNDMKKLRSTNVCSILSVVASLAMVAGCGKKAGGAASAQPDKQSRTDVADYQAWTLVKTWEKDGGKHKAEYVGKEVIIRNLLACKGNSETHMVLSEGYDPKTNTVSSQGDCRYQGKNLVAGDLFEFEIEFADVAEFEKIKDSEGTMEGNKTFSDYQTLYSVKGVVFDGGVDDDLVLKKARLVK